MGQETEPPRAAMENRILKELDGQLDSLCCRGETGSVLGDMTLAARELPSAVYEEVRKRAPLLFKVLTTASWSTTKSSSGQEHFIALIYAMLMRQRNQRLTAHARLMTSLCLRYHAGNQV